MLDREGAWGIFYIVSSEEPNIPTLAQLLQCYTLSCWATRFYLPINLIRLDDRTKNIFMLIGEGIEIEIKPNGQWIK
ncbi:DUF6888 family protein [Microcystis aeruginosa]|uniref:DUF6888 family protein n=1 Tax=Microcystis TaxID=1125 RepID=UPI003A520C59